MHNKIDVRGKMQMNNNQIKIQKHEALLIISILLLSIGLYCVSYQEEKAYISYGQYGTFHSSIEHTKPYQSLGLFVIIFGLAILASAIYEMKVNKH